MNTIILLSTAIFGLRLQALAAAVGVSMDYIILKLFLISYKEQDDMHIVQWISHVWAMT